MWKKLITTYRFRKAIHLPPPLTKRFQYLTPWLTEPGGSMPHSQGLSNNPYPEPNQPNSNSLIPISSRSIQILSSHLRLGLPKGFFPVGLPVKIFEALLLSSILATWPANLNLVDLIPLTILGERYKLWSSSLWSLLHSPFSSLLGPKIRLRILFSNTVSLHSFLRIRYYISWYSTAGNINVLLFLFSNS